MPVIIPIGVQVQIIEAAPPPSTYDPEQYVIRIGTYWLDVTNSSRPKMYHCIASDPSALIWLRLNDLSGEYKDNVFIGNDTGVAVTAGADGDRNVGVGNEALKANTTGSQNVAVGHQAMKANLTGINSAAFGTWTLLKVTTGSNNTAVGHSALYECTTGGSNAAFGWGAGLNITTGSRNVIIGGYSGQTVTSQSDITIIGYNADVLSSSITKGTAVGEGAVIRENGQLALGGMTVSATAGSLEGYLKLSINGGSYRVPIYAA